MGKVGQWAGPGSSPHIEQACHKDNLVSFYGNQFKASVIITMADSCDSRDSLLEDCTFPS